MVLMNCKPDIECIDLRMYSKVITSHVEREDEFWVGVWLFILSSVPPC